VARRAGGRRNGEDRIEAYRYQQLAYLVIPIFLGIEFFITANNEKGQRGDNAEYSLGSYLLDFCGFLFIALVPAFFCVTIWAVTRGAVFSELTLARLDRYGVMFMFLGAWWQIHLLGALRARRLGGRSMHVLAPFLALGVYISLLVLWVAPFGLKWFSMGWFFLLALLLYGLRRRPKTMEKVLWGATLLTFLLTNVVFLFLETVV
jgi:hypothetical protein